MPESEELDLRGLPKSTQLKEALAAVKRAEGGESIRLLTDQEILLKALPLAVQHKGLKLKMKMPSEDLWSIGLEPRI